VDSIVSMNELIIKLATTLSVSTVLGLVIGYFYARIYRGLLLSMSFVHTCVVTVPLVATAIHSVRTVGIGLSNQESQALAFALVGLLGLVRFRTVVRDTREFTSTFA
jgi:hypothetical protein